MLEGATILVVDDDPSLLRLVDRWLSHSGFAVTTTSSIAGARAELSSALPDAILLDLNLPDGSGLDALIAIRRSHPRTPVVMMTVDHAVSQVVSAMQAGAWDYLAKPLTRTKLVTTLGNAIEKGRTDLRIRQLEREVAGGGYDKIIGEAPVMKELFRQLDRVAPSDVTVLIRGESGTGKELVARALHDASARHEAPFVALNCAAIPEGLQESELFGHEKGAFTGASQRRLGRFEQANGGTLFLDEIAELTPALQAKLLRVLQERTLHRVGGSDEIGVDVRIVAATHRDLYAMTAEGSFREDLYYRLAVIELALPALRERRTDIPLLVDHFLEELTFQHRTSDVEVSAEAMALLLSHGWPGNVRELRNALERAVVLASDSGIRPGDLPPQLTGTRPDAALVEAPAPGGQTLDDLERQAIEKVLAETDGNVSEVVRRLGIPRSTLYRRLREYGLR